MSFKMKYDIKKQYLTPNSKRRSGIKMPHVGFIVSHDTGNDGSTAKGNVGYYENSRNEMSASAHTFIDHNEIIECIPATTGTPEKAWHVLYNVTTDNKLFGADSNDVAIGVELCYSHKKGSINNKEAYKRYVWYHAYLCYKFNIDPRKKIVGHDELDPDRKVDPFKNALKIMGISKAQFIQDVVNELAECQATEPHKPLYAVYQGNKHLKDFVAYADAVKYAEQWTDANIRKISDGSWVWSNIEKKDEDDEPMKMELWQKNEIINGVRKYNKVIGTNGEPVINSPEVWVEKVESGTLTAGELASLTFTIMSRTQK
ncbi:peptidoglycan recognition protein family protein [Paenibacillus alvei]|uniref:peptidoglycan recognition protein family protein n=1 Tax=Paenibacillus alvei TaxID=44250 RepID=UPI00227FCC82|nr:peptidoglycan recognition family protein [Paenibacillus alvei]MCY9758390.1 peptidoglycan recognition protein family protein [Paenibacillus alvei]